MIVKSDRLIYLDLFYKLSEIQRVACILCQIVSKVEEIVNVRFFRRMFCNCCAFLLQHADWIVAKNFDFFYRKQLFSFWAVEKNMINVMSTLLLLLLLLLLLYLQM